MYTEGLPKLVRGKFVVFKLGKPVILAAELKECFYCGGTLPATSKEHLFNSSWGGTHKTSQLICNSCNGEFSYVDGTFTDYIKFIMNAWSFKGERHKNVPTIDTGGNWVLGPGGKPALKAPELDVVRRSDGSIGVTGYVRSKSEARRILLGDNGLFEKELGRPLTPEEKEHVQEMIRSSTTQSGQVESATVNVAVNLQAEYRSICHTALKCIGMFDPQFVSSVLSKPAREFARYNQGGWADFAVDVEQHISLTEQAESLYGIHHNSTQIYWSRTNSKVVSTTTILGRIKRSIVLMDAYDGPDAILAVVEDTRGSGIIQARYLEIDTDIQPLPIIEVHSSSMDVERAAQEISQIAFTSMSVDAPLASLFEQLQKTSNQCLTTDTLTDICEAIRVFLENVARAFKVKIDPDKIAKMISDRLVPDMSQYLGTHAAHQDIQSILSHFVIESLSSITE